MHTWTALKERCADERSRARDQGCQPSWCWEPPCVGTWQAEKGTGRLGPSLHPCAGGSTPLTAQGPGCQAASVVLEA